MAAELTRLRRERMFGGSLRLGGNPLLPYSGNSEGMGAGTGGRKPLSRNEHTRRMGNRRNGEVVTKGLAIAHEAC